MAKIINKPKVTRTQEELKIEIELEMSLWSRENWEIHKHLDEWLASNFKTIEALVPDLELELTQSEIYIDSSGIPEPDWTTTLSGSAWVPDTSPMLQLTIEIRPYHGQD